MAEATGLRNNALHYPIYGAPFGIVFGIWDADGDLVTAAAGLDSEVSKNGDTAADCTNEATEIATSSGMYYLLLTGTELTADVVTGITKTSTSGAKTTSWSLYPRKLVTVRSGTAAGGDTGYITLDANASAIDDYYNGMVCIATIDSAVEARVITDYTGSNKQAAVTPSWNTAPDNDDTFIIKLPEGAQIPTVDVQLWKGAAAAAMTGDAYAVVNHADYGNAKLVRSTTPANTLTVDANGAIISASITGGLSSSALNEISIKSASGVWNNESRVITGGSVVATSGSVVATNVLDKANYSLSTSGLGEVGIKTASSVWTETSRTITGGSITGGSVIAVSVLDKTNYSLSSSGLVEVSSKAASGVWNNSTRTVTGGSVVATSGSVVTTSNLDKTNYSLSASGLNEVSVKAASGVWNNAARTITGGSVIATSGSVIATNVLALAASSITSTVLAQNSITSAVIAASAITNTNFALTAGSQVWNAAVRTLSDKTGFVLAASSISGSTIAASAIHTSVISTSAIKSNMFSGSSIDSTVLATNAGSVIWNAAVRSLSDKVNYGISSSALGEISASVSTASGVWVYGIRELTDKVNFGLSTSALGEISGSVSTPQEVWEYAARTITGGSVIAISGSVVVTSVDDKTGYGLSGSALDEISSSLSGVGISASEIWNYVTREVTGGSVIATSGSVTAINVIDKTGYSLSASGLNEISVKAASGVWNNDTKELTDKTNYGLSGSSLTEISASVSTPQEVWEYVTRTVTGGSVIATSGSVVSTSVDDKIGYRLSASGVDDIWDEEQGQHTSVCTFGYYVDSTISGAGGSSAGATAQQVWEYASRIVTGGSITTNNDKDNYGLSDNTLTEISSSMLTASGVWNNTSRTLTDKDGFGLSSSALNEISAITASSVWDYVARTLTDKSNYGLSGSALAEISSSLNNTSISASDVWNYVTREITGGSVVAISGSVTAISVTDKTNYSLSTSGLNEISIKAASGVWNNADRIVTGGSVSATSGSVVAITVDDKIGYSIAASGIGLTAISASAINDQSVTDGTRNEISKNLLKFDLSTITGEASRSVLNAIRFLRNKWSISGTTLTVTKENDTDTAWQAEVSSTESADPITGIDPG